jgi:hypothetical protein
LQPAVAGEGARRDFDGEIVFRREMTIIEAALRQAGALQVGERIFVELENVARLSRYARYFCWSGAPLRTAF